MGTRGWVTGAKLGLRDGTIFRSNSNVICPVQSHAQKYSAFHPTQISGYFRAVPSRQEGRIAIVTNARRDVVDAAASGASSRSQGGFGRE